jgi:hypothetical protein
MVAFLLSSQANLLQPVILSLSGRRTHEGQVDLSLGTSQ